MRKSIPAAESPSLMSRGTAKASRTEEQSDRRLLAGSVGERVPRRAHVADCPQDAVAAHTRLSHAGRWPVFPA